MFPETPAPAKSWLLVFVSDDMDAMRAAAAAAAAAGYERTAVLEGGVQALSQGALQQVREELMSVVPCGVPLLACWPSLYWLHQQHGIFWLSAYGAVPGGTRCRRVCSSAVGCKGWAADSTPCSAHAAAQRELKHISRDALAAVLGVAGERGARAEGVRVLDVRRHDERVLYGSIPGAARKCQSSWLGLLRRHMRRGT